MPRQDLRFEWDPLKAASNLAKHGIAFADAREVFDDPLQRNHQDRHEGVEERWQTLGLVRGVLLLLVAHTWTEQDGDEVIRIVSARRASKQERRDYEHGSRGR